MKTLARRNIYCVSLIAATAVGLVGCSTTATSATLAESTTASAKPHVIVIPQQTGAAPGSYVNSDNKLVGFMPDMSTAIGKEMGVKVENVATTFENALLGLASGKYAAVPGADVTPQRLQTMDFALQWKDAYTFQVAAKTAKKIGKSMNDLCGLSIAVVAASSPIVPLDAQSSKCVAAGAKPVDVMTFPDWASANLAADSGQADAATGNVSSLDYQVKETPGKAVITGPVYQSVNIGFAVTKGSKWGPKIVKAMNKIIADGTYKKIMDKYGESGIANLKKSVLITK